MKNKDIETRADIELLVDTFYGKARADELLGPVFNTIIGNDWSHHLPVIYQFWETVILQKPGYSGNPVGKHVEIDKKMPLDDRHYARWVALWHQTTDNLFAGERADEVKNRGMLMMNLIKIKITAARGGHSLH